MNTVKEINKKERTQGEQNMSVEKVKDNDNGENDSDHEWCEETQRPSGIMDTLLQ